jgi:hypothetical protein
VDGERAENAVGGFDPEEVTRSLRQLCRRPSRAFTAQDGALIASTFNTLDDWLCMGNPLPASWDPRLSVMARTQKAARGEGIVQPEI